MMRSCIRALHLGSMTALLHPSVTHIKFTYDLVLIHVWGIQDHFIPSHMRFDSVTASASATSLPDMCLISKTYGCIVSNHI